MDSNWTVHRFGPGHVEIEMRSDQQVFVGAAGIEPATARVAAPTSLRQPVLAPDLREQGMSLVDHGRDRPSTAAYLDSKRTVAAQTSMRLRRARALFEMTVGFLSGVGIYRLALILWPDQPLVLPVAVTGWLAVVWCTWRVLARRAPRLLVALDLLLFGTAFATIAAVLAEAMAP